MTREDIVKQLLTGAEKPTKARGRAFAPVNIALCKYWGKRNDELNLPLTSSLSISMGAKGTTTQIQPCMEGDRLTLNGEFVPPDTAAAQRLSLFLDLFRSAETPGFDVVSTSSVPMAAGLASSAAAFAALVKALDDLFGWGLDGRPLSILARMGSGSASRSVYEGFVEWHVGVAEDGMDSFAEPLETTWPELRVGLLTLSDTPKPIGSREAMKRTRETSTLYENWPIQVANDLIRLKEAIRDKHFRRLGTTAESNALAMHATMIATVPPVLYWRPESVEAMQQIWALRKDGLDLYFTMDAGPNLKLLFERIDTEAVRSAFPTIDVVEPFGRHGLT